MWRWSTPKNRPTAAWCPPTSAPACGPGNTPTRPTAPSPTTKLEGGIVFDGVDFGYTDEKIVLHDIKPYAKPGQKIAFVGSTGAGKTTITNLINRFYDIQDGKIRYDGINITKIKSRRCAAPWALCCRTRTCSPAR